MALVMVLTGRRCKHCDSWLGAEVAAIKDAKTYTNFQCSLCNVEFCLDCMKVLPQGDGSNVLCPGCKAHLQLPIQPLVPS